MTSNNETAQPVVCTLTDKQQHSQLLEWANLTPLTTTTKRLTNGIVLEFDPSHAPRVVDLAQRESGCCGTWVSISTEVRSDLVRLTATTEADEGLEILHAMLGVEKW